MSGKLEWADAAPCWLPLVLSLFTDLKSAQTCSAQTAQTCNAAAAVLSELSYITCALLTSESQEIKQLVTMLEIYSNVHAKFCG